MLILGFQAEEEKKKIEAEKKKKEEEEKHKTSAPTSPVSAPAPVRIFVSRLSILTIYVGRKEGKEEKRKGIIFI